MEAFLVNECFAYVYIFYFMFRKFITCFCAFSWQVKEEDDAIVDKKLQIRLKHRRHQKKSKQVSFRTSILLFHLFDPETVRIILVPLVEDVVICSFIYILHANDYLGIKNTNQ